MADRFTLEHSVDGTAWAIRCPACALALYQGTVDQKYSFHGVDFSITVDVHDCTLPVEQLGPGQIIPRELPPKE